MDWILVITLVVVVLVIAVVALKMPRGSGGAPGEVMADTPLSEPTGAAWDDREDAGPAEDRPAGPDAESMDPDANAAPATERTDSPPEDRR